MTLSEFQALSWDDRVQWMWATASWSDIDDLVTDALGHAGPGGGSVVGAPDLIVFAMQAAIERQHQADQQAAEAARSSSHATWIASKS